MESYQNHFYLPFCLFTILPMLVLSPTCRHASTLFDTCLKAVGDNTNNGEKKFEASKGKEADYESWVASYTFSFSNHNDAPNTYKEFGFGDKH